MNMLYLHMPFSVYIVTRVLVLMSHHILFRGDRWKDGQTDMTKANSHYLQLCKHTYKALNIEFTGN